jgi:hypothetical protein
MGQKSGPESKPQIVVDGDGDLLLRAKVAFGGVLATSNRKPPLRISYPFRLLAVLSSHGEG